MIEQDPRQLRRPGSEQAKLAEAATEVDARVFFAAVAEAILQLLAMRDSPA